VESAHHALGSGLVQVAKLVDRALHAIGCDIDATCIAPGGARLDCTANRTSQQAASGLTRLHKIVAVQNRHDVMVPQSHRPQSLTST